LYVDILDQAKQAGLKLRLPVSASQHQRLQSSTDCECLLRAFYVLGGSLDDVRFQNNQIDLLIVVATKTSVLGHATAIDDAADINSFVNQAIDEHQAQMFKFTLKFELHDAAHVLLLQRDTCLPCYKYMKM